VLVDTIGTHAYSAPERQSCNQYDIYAEFVSNGGFDALAVPDKLLGPNNPYEPKFLHQALAGKGPNPTWSYTSSEGCNPPPPVKNQVTGTAEFTTATCESPLNTIATKGPEGEVGGTPGGVWTLTDKNGATYTSAVGGGVSTAKNNGGVPGGLAFGDITVTLSDADAEDDYVVTPWSGTWHTVNPDTLDCNTVPQPPEPKVEYSQWQDQKWVCGDTEVTQTRTKTTTPYKVVLVDDEYQIVEDTENVTVVTETQTRALTNKEIGTCPLGVGGVNAVCVGDVPYFQYDQPTLPEGFVPVEGATMSVTFHNPAGPDYVVSGLPIAAGKFLWPGATDGAIKNWPGWVRNADGTYSQTTGNYAWTRPSVLVTFKVNPEYTVTVNYPAATSLCANPPANTPPTTPPAYPPTDTVPPTLASTGFDPWTSAALAGLAIIAGLCAVIVARRRREA